MKHKGQKLLRQYQQQTVQISNRTRLRLCQRRIVIWSADSQFYTLSSVRPADQSNYKPKKTMHRKTNAITQNATFKTYPKQQVSDAIKYKTRMSANAQCDGRPAKYRWRLLFNAAVWLTPTARVPCSNAAKTRNPLKFAGVPQTRQWISAVTRLKFTILSGHVEEVMLFNKFFSNCQYMP